ncbi:P-loop containing nucleoside triphosphate hydrolases superfamily protein isoform X1 [Wolffia australiana]
MVKRSGRIARQILNRFWRSHSSIPPISNGNRFQFFSSLLFSPSICSFSSSNSIPRCRTTSFSSSTPAFFGILTASVVGLLEWSHADADEEVGNSCIPVASSPVSDSDAMDRLVRGERLRLEELLRKNDVWRGSYPAFVVSGKGQKITVKFRIPPSCEASHLIVDLVSHLGLKAEKHGGGSEMLVRAWDSAVSWQLTLNYPEENVQTASGDSNSDYKRQEGNLCILIYESLVSSGNCEIEFIKDGMFTSVELDALVSALKLAGEKTETKKKSEQNPWRSVKEKQKDPQLARVIPSLEAMGVRVYGIDEAPRSSCGIAISWDNIAGYEQQKREIEDTILLSLQYPQLYDEIAWGTRCKFETNRPRAVLFEGPPGTGKTSCARVIASQAGVPLLYVPLEVVLSKYYGESEKFLGNVFSLANDLPDGAIIFLDEVDSFAASRDSEIHEATRRMLSVLLRQIDGFEQDKRVIVIAATNRKQDLDPALISRFDTVIPFFLPDYKNREKIASQYAKHLNSLELTQLADATEGMSGRDIRDICQQAERHWASKLIREQGGNELGGVRLPPLEEYMECAKVRGRMLVQISEERKTMPSSSLNTARDRGLLGIV